MGVIPVRLGRPVITSYRRHPGNDDRVVLRFDWRERPGDDGILFEMWDDEAAVMARIILDELEGITMEGITMETEATTNRTEADEAIAGLRELIEFFDENPEAAKLFGTATLYAFSYSEESWRDTNRMLGRFDKNSTTYDLEAKRKFGKITLTHCIQHEAICERKVTGTRTVTKSEPIGDVEYHDVTAEEEIVEWVCPPGWR